MFGRTASSAEFPMNSNKGMPKMYGQKKVSRKRNQASPLNSMEAHDNHYIKKQYAKRYSSY